MQISEAQIRKIRAMAAQLHMEETKLRYLVKSVTGSNSIAHLSAAQAQAVIEKLTDELKVYHWQPDLFYEEPMEEASLTQIGHIKKLTYELGKLDNPKWIKRLLRHMTGKDKVGQLKKQEASKVIEALKQMLKKRKNSTHPA